MVVKLKWTVLMEYLGVEEPEASESRARTRARKSTAAVAVPSGTACCRESGSRTGGC